MDKDQAQAELMDLLAQINNEKVRLLSEQKRVDDFKSQSKKTIDDAGILVEMAKRDIEKYEHEVAITKVRLGTLKEQEQNGLKALELIDGRVATAEAVILTMEKTIATNEEMQDRRIKEMISEQDSHKVVTEKLVSKKEKETLLAGEAKSARKSEEVALAETKKERAVVEANIATARTILNEELIENKKLEGENERLRAENKKLGDETTTIKGEIKKLNEEKLLSEQAVVEAIKNKDIELKRIAHETRSASSVLIAIAEKERLLRDKEHDLVRRYKLIGLDTSWHEQT